MPLRLLFLHLGVELRRPLGDVRFELAHLGGQLGDAARRYRGLGDLGVEQPLEYDDPVSGVGRLRDGSVGASAAAATAAAADG